MLTFFDYSCSTDDSILVPTAVDESEISPPDTTWVEREMGINEVKDIPSVYRAIQNINELPALQEKESLQAQDKQTFDITDYTVDMTLGVEIEQFDQISYTFPLIPKEEITSDILNIVFTVSKEGLVGMGIVMYYLTEEDWQILSGEEQTEVEVPVGYLALDNNYEPIVVETTEVDGGERHLTTRLAPIDHNNRGNSDNWEIQMDEIILRGSSSGSFGGPSFSVGSHNSSFGGNQGGYGGTGGAHGGGGTSGGATKPVTAPNEVIIDVSFENNKCLNDIYEKMGGVSGFNKYLKRFKKDNNPVANLKLSGSTKLPEKNYANTIEPKHYMIEIEFNLNELNNRSSLDVARTMMHEMIHAEMYRKILSVIGKPEIPWTEETINTLRNSYSGIADYYTRWRFEVPKGIQPSIAQHEQMAQHYRGIIEDALRAFDGSYPDKMYEDLAWIGLMGDGQIDMKTGLPSNPTVAWKNKSKEERLRIIKAWRDLNKKERGCKL